MSPSGVTSIALIGDHDPAMLARRRSNGRQMPARSTRGRRCFQSGEQR
jgi:hypothetical protein